MAERVFSDHGRARRMMANPAAHPDFQDDNGEKMAPAEALAAGLCPETGVPLKGVDIEAHIRSLWPRPLPNEAKYDGARNLQKLLRQYAADQAQQEVADQPPPPKA